MTIPTQRLEAAARAMCIARESYRYCSACGSKENCTGYMLMPGMAEALSAAYPELHTDPPTAWIAPWIIPGTAGRQAWNLQAAWEAMRDSHLSAGEEGKHEQERGK